MAYVLVVDDDILARQSIRRTLERAGHDVTEAGNGKQALTILEKESPTVVIMDLIMPDMEGIETIREIRRRGSTVNNLAVSGGGRIDADTYLDYATSLGANRVLEKPFNRDALLDAIAQLSE